MLKRSTASPQPMRSLSVGDQNDHQQQTGEKWKEAKGHSKKLSKKTEVKLLLKKLICLLFSFKSFCSPKEDEVIWKQAFVGVFILFTG